MQIDTYHIKTSSGEITSWGDSLPFLSGTELNEFNSIGYTGKTTKGERISRNEYLNSLNKGTFKVKQTKCDHGDFSEEFVIIRVTPDLKDLYGTCPHFEGCVALNHSLTVEDCANCTKIK